MLLAESPDRSNPTQRKKKILIVEDEYLTCKLYKMILHTVECDIEFAYDGQQGIDRYQNDVFDLVLTDVDLPVIKGYELTKLIRDHDESRSLRPVPIIAISGNRSAEAHVMTIENGADQFIPKPINPKTLLNLVTFYLGLNAR